MMSADDHVESMDFFGHPSDDDVLSMPSFEVSNSDDRPIAPPAEDYPLGCEVELRDIEYARLAQESGHWEPFMEEVFSLPRRRVKVGRHAGDYTFVICTDLNGFDVVGCTLYRACLSEPKVQTTKYYANVAQREDDEQTQTGSDCSQPRRSPSDNDLFSRPVGPSSAFFGGADAPAPKMSPSRPPTIPVEATGDAADSLQPRSPHSRLTSTNVGQVRRRNKFAAAMKRGTKELEARNYDRALHYYNAAMQEAPEEESRVLSSRSVAYLLLRQTENALNDAKRVIELTPDSYLGYVRAGNVLRGMKQFADAQAYYKDALRRDSSNTTIRKLLLENSVAMLYDARVKRFPKIKIIFDSSRVRILAAARQALKREELVLKETTPLMSIVSSRYSDVLSGASSSKLCHNCGRPFVDESEMCARIPGLRPELFRSLYNEPVPVPCNYECHAMYCSEECRSKSWAFHHWVECRVHGRWSAAVAAVHKYLDEYIMNSPTVTYPDPSTAPQNAIVDTSPLVVAAAARVAVRMFSRMLSCVWHLKDAVHMFDWLRVSPVVESQRQHVRPVLRECYRLVSMSLAGEECSKFTYELYERCYERVKSNAILVRVSAWNKIHFRAESHMALVDGEGSSHAHGGVPHSSAMSASQVDAQHESLRYILNAPPEGIPGTFFTCLAVFELYAATGYANIHCSSRHRTPPQPCPTPARPGGAAAAEIRPNVELQSLIEPQVCIHVRASTAIAKNDPLISSTPQYPPYWLQSDCK